MAYPTKPSIQTSYTAVEQALGDGTLPGQELDNDLANLKTSLDALNDFVRGVTRSDGKLANQSVRRETLGPDILLGFGAPTEWSASRAYAPPQTVFFEDAFYICVIEHTSGASFATDLTANRWELLVDFGAVLDGALAAEDGAQAVLAEFRTRYIGAAASDPALDPAGGALIDGALYWNNGARRLKAYDLATTAWYFVAPTAAEQTNINTVAGISADVTSVAGVAASVPTVAAIDANVTTVAGIAPNVTTVAGVSADVTTVATNIADVNTVAGLTAEIAALPGQVTAAQTAASDAETALDSFDDRYLGAKVTAPALDNDGDALLVGAIYWDTGSNQMFTWDGAEWVPTFLTGNTVRSLVTATSGQTVFTTPTYRPGLNTLSVFVNGVKVLLTTDYAETTQNSITFAAGLTAGDEVELIAVQSLAVYDLAGKNYVTRAAFLADTAYTPADGTVVTAGGVSYVRDASATAISDLSGWLPFGDVTPQHFGAVGDGVTNDAEAIQAAINAAAASSSATAPVVVSLGGKQYGVSNALSMNAADFVSLEDGGLIAMGTGWVATDPILTMVTALADSLKTIGLRNLFIDCAHNCAGVLLKNTYGAFLDHVHVTHAKTYHIKAETKNTELTLTACIANQYFWGETGFELIANRTAFGLWIDCADAKLIGCTSFYCLEPLRGTGGTTQVVGCHFYNGATVDGTDNVAIHLYGARGYMISECYIDNGILRITGGTVTGLNGSGDEFNHRITGTIPGPGGAGNTTVGVELVALDANETAGGLMVDISLRGLAAGNGLRQSVSGGGSWSILNAKINFIDGDGAMSAFGRVAVPDGTADAPGFVFSSEADTNTGLYRRGIDQIGFAANGTGIAFVSRFGIEAHSAGVGLVGSIDRPFFAVHARNLRVADGVTAPGTVTGFASIYVDNADGDLKIKFSDGTVKTIVTDT